MLIGNRPAARLPTTALLIAQRSAAHCLLSRLGTFCRSVRSDWKAYAQALSDHGIPIDERIIKIAEQEKDSMIAAINELFDSGVAARSAYSGHGDQIAQWALVLA